MKPLRIGIIDSGKGGLTVANALRTHPGFELYYYADTKNLPYGNKSTQQLHVILDNALHHVAAYNVDYIILACHTLSTIIDQTSYTTVPIIAMLETVIPQACAITQTNTIGILATQASITTGAHKAALRAHKPHANIIEQSCPELASALERFPSHHPHVQQLLQTYMQAFDNSNIDTLILGCTHYAFAHKEITALCSNAVQIVSSEMYIFEVMKAMHIMPSSCTSASTIIFI